ncbi:MAG: GntR family transcriptional regulator [Leucobacter sp.]|nr:GntR family transcriptional regulator [Leucobacter sp.]
MFEDSRPIFQQIAEGIVDDILRGRYAEGQQVPSTNELAAYLRINPATAGKGLGLLVDQGILVKRRGIGMFVAEGARERVAAERRERFATDFIEPLLMEARTIGLDREALIRLIADAQTGGASASAPPTTD